MPSYTKMTKYNFVKNLRTKKENVANLTLNTILKHVSKHSEGYEVISSSCIPYYDFDKEYVSSKLQSEQKKSDLNQALNALKLQYPTARIYTFTSSGFDPIKKVYKTSFHFRIRGAGYYSNASSIPFPKHMDGVFDKTVYNNKHQLFRLPYCTKKGQNRLLKRFDVDTGKIYDYDELPDEYAEYLVQNIQNEKLIQSPITTPTSPTSQDVDIDKYVKLVESKSDILNNMSYKSHTVLEESNKIIINFRRLSSSHCTTCDRIHDADATPFITILEESNKIFWCCIRNKINKFICKIDDSKDTIDCEKVDKLTRDGLQFNVKYCSEIDIFNDSIKNKNHETIFVKSNMGTGKTYACAKSLLDSLYNTAGIISFRISLAKKYSEDFPGFACYNKTKGSITDDKWICQADSLHRINPKVLDYLILDECSQIRKHTTADTYLRSPNYLKNRASLRYMIRTAKQVICMDANLSDDDKNWINNLRGSTNQLVIVNNYISHKRTVNLITKNQIMIKISDDILNKRKFILAHNGSKTKIDAIARRLCANILVIHADTFTNNNVITALQNPNIEFGKYDGVIYSPSVQSGLSYDIKNVFHTIYGMFGNASNSTGDACQMLHRIRNPISDNLFVSIDMYNFGNEKPTTPQRMIEIMKTNRNHLIDSAVLSERVPFDYDKFGVKQFTESEILDEYCKNKCEHNLDSIMFRTNFIKKQISYGNIIIDDKKKDDEIEKKEAVELKKNVNDILDDDATALNNAIDLDESEVIILQKKIEEDPNSITKENYIEIKKHKINKLYKTKSVNSVPWYRKYNNDGLKRHYINLSLYFKKKTFCGVLNDLKNDEIKYANARISEDEYKCIDQQIVDSIISKPRYQKHKILIEWLRVLGFDSLNSIHRFNGIEKIKKCVIDANVCNVFGTKQDAILYNYREKLKYINARLESEFGIKIKKYGNVKSEIYHLVNKYIDDNTFEIEPNINNIPVLGMTLEKQRDEDHYNKFIELYDDDPYDSDEELEELEELE